MTVFTIITKIIALLTLAFEVVMLHKSYNRESIKDMIFNGVYMLIAAMVLTA